MGLSKRVHSTELLASLEVTRINDMINKNISAFYRRIFKVQSPLLDLTSHLLSLYMSRNVLIPGTIINDIVSLGISPINCAFNDQHLPHLPNTLNNGHIDSIRSMIFHENFIKPYSDEHTLVYLLTKSF